MAVTVNGTQQVRPAYNQARPWLAGNWHMSYPADFLVETGGIAATAAAAAGDSIRPLRELAALSIVEQEAALVDDLLSVLLGQAGEYVVCCMVEGPKWQRLALRVRGVTEPSMVEQVCRG